MTRQVGIIKMKLYNISYFFREAFSSIFTHRLMSVAATGVIMACLLLMGSFTLLSVNIEHMLEEVEAKNQVVVFVNETYTAEQAQAMAADVKAVENVVDAQYVSREQALEEFRVELGEDSNLLDGLGSDNPLRNRYVITMKDQALTQQTADALRKVEGVADVQARTDISDKIVQLRHIVSAVCIVLILMLFAVSVFIISNTVNLTIFNRKEEIAIMKMVGAGNGFVRAPFMLEGMILGAAGALIAYLLQWGLYEYLIGVVLADFSIFAMIGFGETAGMIAILFAVVGILVGSIGSGITMRKYLRV